jgi:hypothetical protein
MKRICLHVIQLESRCFLVLSHTVSIACGAPRACGLSLSHAPCSAVIFFLPFVCRASCTRCTCVFGSAHKCSAI